QHRRRGDQPAAQEDRRRIPAQAGSHGARRGLRREGLMQTIRWRLAAFYGVALTATIVAFGGALYVERRSSLLRDEEAQLRERIAFELDVNRRYIEDYSRSSRRVVTAVSAIGDLMSYELVPEVNAYLDGISDHLFLMDPAGRL